MGYFDLTHSVPLHCLSVKKYGRIILKYIYDRYYRFRLFDRYNIFKYNTQKKLGYMEGQKYVF